MSNIDRSRKWLITINNPQEKGYSHQVIREKLSLFTSAVYWCMSDEIGEEGTYHTHIYLALSNASRFETVRERFLGAHLDIARGTSQQNRDYVFKEGKWLKDKKKETNLRETHEEWGEMPIERQGARNDLYDLKDMISSGMSDYEIINAMPQYMMKIDKIDRVRQIIKNEKFREVFRKLEVTYIYGKSGTGKTRSVMEKYGYSQVYRVTDYEHPFDNYRGQDVIVFEEFRSSLKIRDMLNYLDGYPLDLPCRYNNKVACYTKVYILTNLSLHEQYESIQTEHKETWDAFLRRIHKVIRYDLHGQEVFTIEEYFKKVPKVYTLDKSENEKIMKMFRGEVYGNIG